MYLIHDQKNGRQQIWVSVVDGAWQFHVHGAGRDIRVADRIEAACDLIGADPKPMLKACPAFANEGPAPCAS